MIVHDLGTQTTGAKAGQTGEDEYVFNCRVEIQCGNNAHFSGLQAGEGRKSRHLVAKHTPEPEHIRTGAADLWDARVRVHKRKRVCGTHDVMNLYIN